MIIGVRRNKQGDEHRDKNNEDAFCRASHLASKDSSDKSKSKSNKNAGR